MDDRFAAETATGPARWLLELGGSGIALTQTGALARAVVREAAERWPGWWRAELFGPPHRETDVAPLHSLHEGLRRLRLLRRRGRALYTTGRGRRLASDPLILLEVCAADLGAGDAFAEVIAAAAVSVLGGQAAAEHDQLVAAGARAALHGGWHDGSGRAPDEHDLSPCVSEVLCRGEAYGVIERLPENGPRFARSQIALTAAGRAALGLDPAIGARVLVFDALLLDTEEVTARLAVRSDQPLAALHDAIQEAFGWLDDHLYAFWLDGQFWGDAASEYTSPVSVDTDARTAEIRLRELDLSDGARVAYVFDFGDNWRVLLTLREQTTSDAGEYPRVLHRHETPPLQYAPAEENV